MVTTKIKKLATLREKVARLELVIETELYEDLFGIHQRYGFAELKSFIEAVKIGCPWRRSEKGGRWEPQEGGRDQKRRRRAKITDATRAKVKKAGKGRIVGLQDCQDSGDLPPERPQHQEGTGTV